MPEEPNGHGLAWLLAAKVVCCGALLLAATGALSLGGLAGWLLDGGIAWLAIAALAGVSFYLWRHHPVERRPPEPQEQETESRDAT